MLTKQNWNFLVNIFLRLIRTIPRTVYVIAFNLSRPQAERIEREKTVLFTKQGIFPREENPVTLQEKQNSEAEIRAAEEEGIYVPEVLLPPRRVWIALEHRLLREGAMHWFGEDGHLKGLVGKFKTSSKKGLS